ncbi:hypothetical protein SLA2020_452410 [Shorea laevis]
MAPNIEDCVESCPYRVGKGRHPNDGRKDRRRKGEGDPGRIGVERKINKAGLPISSYAPLETYGDCEFQEIQDNLWIFEFSDDVDRIRFSVADLGLLIDSHRAE